VGMILFGDLNYTDKFIIEILYSDFEILVRLEIKVLFQGKEDFWWIERPYEKT
jgi:hypothetical protein